MAAKQKAVCPRPPSTALLHLLSGGHPVVGGGCAAEDVGELDQLGLCDGKLAACPLAPEFFDESTVRRASRGRAAVAPCSLAAGSLLVEGMWPSSI